MSTGKFHFPQRTKSYRFLNPENTTAMMRRVTLFLSTSILESLLKATSLSLPTQQFLRNCRAEGSRYIAYYSFLSIHELYQEYSIEEIQEMLQSLKAYNVRLLVHKVPQEVDRFMINKQYRKSFQINNEYEQYNLAYYGVTSIESFVTWNQVDSLKFGLKEKLIKDYLSSGFQAFRYFELYSPPFFFNSEEDHYQIQLEDVLPFSEYKPVTLVHQAEYKYDYIQKWGFHFIQKHKLDIQIEEFPNKTIRPQRIPKTPLDPNTKNISVSIHDYEEQIKAKEIPFLHFQADKVSFDTDYHLLKISLTEGQEIIKGILDDMLFLRKVKEETYLDDQEFKALKIAELFNKLLPSIQIELDGPDNQYDTFEKNEIKEVLIKNVDSNLTNAFLQMYNPYEIKRAAIDLIEWLLADHLLNYRAFQTEKKWTKLHDYGGGAVDARSSIFLVEKTGTHLFVISISCYID